MALQQVVVMSFAMHSVCICRLVYAAVLMMSPLQEGSLGQRKMSPTRKDEKGVKMSERRKDERAERS